MSPKFVRNVIAGGLQGRNFDEGTTGSRGTGTLSHGVLQEWLQLTIANSSPTLPLTFN